MEEELLLPTAGDGRQWLVNMVEEELLPPAAGMTANGWSGMPPAWPLANDGFALLPLLVQLFSHALVHVQEENLRQVGDEDVAGFIRKRKRLAR